ncbi:MAG: hypothetical protein NTW29_13275 [Bacteroidetes bacterium]|nr:hypothetical protein [Bacteroidota bacterium]
MKKIISILFFCSWINLPAQNELRNDTFHQITRTDTVFISKERPIDSVLSNYQQILEKTNSQLGMWSNPYGILIGCLGVMITLLGIGVAFVIYKQGKDARDLIKESLNKHEVELDKLINEKNNYFKNFEISLNKSIQEYQERLSRSQNLENKEQILEFISKLEEQKDIMDLKIHTHSGYSPQDIAENYIISESTLFYTKINLSNPNQSFIIYLRIVASDGKKYWLGFGGNIKDTPGKTKYEYTSHSIYPTKNPMIQEKVLETFRLGFPELNCYPIRIDNIRLRGSDTDLGQITFSYKIT